MIEYEQVVERFAQRISVLRGLSQWETLPVKQTRECGLACQEACFRQAEWFLRMTWDNGEPMLLVGAQDQSWPHNSTWMQSQQAVREVGFRRILKGVD